jgi:poly(beta-D-mannuronate) lyase
MMGRLICISLCLCAGPVATMTVAEREALDLSAYVVTNPHAGYFDVSARRVSLRSIKSSELVRETAELSKPFSCQTYLAQPVMSKPVHIPLLSEDRESWRVATEPFRAFEDAVSNLAAVHLVTGDFAAGTCLLRLLSNWADADALLQILEPQHELQAWFQVESTLAAAALAYAVVRSSLTEHTEEKARIDDWLNRAARRHLAYQGGSQSCCNNHLYRRGVYAAMIGVLTSDNELFQESIAAVLSALSDSSASGALPLEMARGSKAAHYQNYATMHLVLIARIASLQGYDLYEINYGGRTLANIIRMTERVLSDPQVVSVEGVNVRQDDSFLGRAQYLAWLELVPPGILSSRGYEFRDSVRPSYVRNLGGHLTLYVGDLIH